MGTQARRRSRARVPSGIVATLLLGLLWTAPMASAAESTPEDRAAAFVRPAVVYVEAFWSAYVRDHEDDWLNYGDPYEWQSRCSGFVVNPSGYVVTAGHCVDDSHEGARATAIQHGVEEWIANGWASEAQRQELTDIAFANWTVEGRASDSPPDRTVYVQHGVAASGLRTGQAWPARVVEWSPLSRGDVALLKVEQSNLPVAEVAADADVVIGTDVLSIGYPASSDLVTDENLEPTYKDGKVSSKKTRDDGLLPVYEVSSALSSGMSGGPTANLDGAVVGVNSYTIVGEAQQFNFLSPASLVTEMLARNAVSNELGPVDELYRSGLERYFAGDYPEAIERFDDALDRVPSHQQAQEFRIRAVEAAAAEPHVEPSEARTDQSAGEDPTKAEPVVEQPQSAVLTTDAGTAGGVSVGLVAVIVVFTIGALLTGMLITARRMRPRAEPKD